MSAEGEPIGYLLARIHSNMDRRANNNLKASGMTFSLVRSGFDRQDRRVKSVYLTEAGRGFMSAVYEHHEQMEQAITAGLDAAEVAALRALLRRVLNNVLNDDGGKPC